jgi:hypothetical protein
MMSLRRSVNQRMPSASKCPTSPEWNQPCSNAALAAWRLSRYPVRACGPGKRSPRTRRVCQQRALLVHDRDLNVDHGGADGASMGELVLGTEQRGGRAHLGLPQEKVEVAAECASLTSIRPVDLAMFNAPFQPARTDFDWLTRDESMVDLHRRSILRLRHRHRIGQTHVRRRSTVGRHTNWRRCALTCRSTSPSVRATRSTPASRCSPHWWTASVPPAFPTSGSRLPRRATRDLQRNQPRRRHHRLDGLDSRRRVRRLLGRRPESLGSLCEVKPTLSRPTAPGRPSPVAGDPRERSYTPLRDAERTSALFTRLAVE